MSITSVEVWNIQVMGEVLGPQVDQVLWGYDMSSVTGYSVKIYKFSIGWIVFTTCLSQAFVFPCLRYAVQLEL